MMYSLKATSADCMWHKIDESLWNPYLTYQQNRMNGCDLPLEDMPVLIYDTDKPKYLVGRIGIHYYKDQKRLVVYESVHGEIYGGVSYILWHEIDYI